MTSQHSTDRKPLALVTGASSGIGLELAKQFAENGYDLLISGQHAHISEAAEACRQLGGEVTMVQSDLSSAAGVKILWDKFLALKRPLAAVAINAGVGVGGSFVDDTSLEDELRMIDLNVKSSVHLAKLAAAELSTRGQGHILLTSSIAGTMPTPFEAVYGATKAFIQSFAMSLRSELGDKGVVVTALLPGATETNFFHRAGMDDTKVGASDKDDAAEVAKTGFAALMKGEAQVVAGSFKNKIFASKIVPEAVKAGLHKQMSEPGSASKQ